MIIFLVDGHRVAPQAHLRLDPGAVILAGRMDGGRAWCDSPASARHRRWPGWGILPVGTGGHGGIGRDPGQPADRLAIDAHLACDLVLRDPALQKRPNGLLLLWLQDIYLRIPLLSKAKGR